MQSRKIGNQGLEVPSLGLGCMGMTFAYQKADESQCLATLDRSLELGLNFWDTAQSYGPFTNEILLGKALKGRREKVVLATKFAWKDGIPGKDNLDGSAQNARNTLKGMSSASRNRLRGIFTICTVRIPKFPLRNPSERWDNWFGKARFVILD